MNISPVDCTVYKADNPKVAEICAQQMSRTILGGNLAKMISVQNVPITWGLVILLLEIYPAETFPTARQT